MPAGTSVANGHTITALQHSLRLPSKIAIVHSSAHIKKTDTVSLGNDKADEAANNRQLKMDFLILSLPHF